MASKKNYDNYNIVASSKRDYDVEQEVESAASRIFKRRRELLNQNGAENKDYGYSPAEVFKKRKELMQIRAGQSQRTPAQTDVLRADRQQAAELYKQNEIEKFNERRSKYLSPYEANKKARENNITNQLIIKGQKQMNDQREQSIDRKKEQQEASRILEKTGIQDGYQFKRYMDMENNPDYLEMVKEGQKKENVFSDNNHTYGPLDYFDKEKRAVLQGTQYNFTRMNDTEKNLYFYINGKYGPETATNYIESINTDLNQRNVESVQGNAAELSKEHPIIGTGLNAGISAVGSGSYPVLLARQGIRNAMGNYEPLDPNDPLFGSAVIGEGIRSGIANNETFKKIVPNEGVRNFLSGTGLSMTENLARLPFGHFGRAAAAGGAGLAGTRDALLRGGSTDQAIALGMSNAAAEAFFEKFSLEGLQSLKIAPGKSVKEFLKNLGKQAVTEGSEEIFTEIANTLSDDIIMGEISQYNIEYENNIRQGMDENTAKNTAFQSFLSNLALSGAGGALSGGILGGGSQALGVVQNNIALNQYGKSIDQDYREYSQGIDIYSESYANQKDYQEAVSLQQIAQEYADRQANKEFVSDKDKAEYDIRWRKFIDRMENQETSENQLQSNLEPQEGDLQDQAESQLDNLEREEYEPFREEYNEPVLEQGELSENREIANKEELDEWAKAFGVEGREAFKELYNDETDIPTFYKAYAKAYNAGRYNMDISGPGRAEAAIVLSPEQFSAAFKAGARDQNLESGYDPQTYQMIGMKQAAPKEGGLGFVAENVTDSQKVVASHIGKLTGLQIDLVDSMENGKLASYTKGRITLSVNSSDFNGALSHELTHFIKDYSPDLFQIYQNTAVKALTEAKGVKLESMISNYMDSYARSGKEISRAEAIDEIVADATQKFLNDPDYISRVVHEDASLGQRIVDFFADVIEAIKELIKTGSTRKAAKGLEENLHYFEDCRRVWFAAVDEGGERYKSGMELSDETKEIEKFVLEKPDQVNEKIIDKNYESVRKMDAVTSLSGTEFEKGEKDLVTQVSDFYKSIGGRVHNDVVGDIFLDRDSVKDDIGHGIGRAKAITFAAVPDILRDGYVLDYKENWKGRGYDSAVLGAKVKITEGKYAGEYYVLTVVKLLEANKMYLHEVHTIKVGDVMPFKTPDLKGGNTRSDTYTLPPIYSIFDRLVNVKDEQKQSIKYQMEDVDDTVTQNRIDALVYENQLLKDAQALLEKQFQITPKSEVRQQDIIKIAKGFLKNYNSTYKQETLVQNLDRLYSYIRGAEQVDGAEIIEAATSIAKSILKQSEQIDAELTQMYKAMRKQIKNTKIKITDQDKADLAIAGGYNDFRKRNFGRITLSKDGISVDSIYQELTEQHPELFPNDITHPADQLMAIADALDQTDAQVSNPYNANMEEMSYILGQDILQAYFEVRSEKPTYADRKAAEVQKVKRDYSRKMLEYKESLKRQYESKLYEVKKENLRKIQEIGNTYKNLSEVKQKEIKDYYKQQQHNLRNEKNQRLAAMQRKNQEQVRKLRESQRARDAKKIIIKEAKIMQNWLLKPTDSKHIPQSLRTTVAGFLSNIDYSSNELNNNGIETLRTQEWYKVKAEFEKIINVGGAIQEDGNVLYMEVDPDLVSRIEELSKKTEGITKLEDLDAYSMEELKKVVLSMKKAITEANSLKSNTKYREISLLADDIFMDLEAKKSKIEYIKLAGKADNLLNYDMLDSQTMFEQFGPSAKTMYDALRLGLDKKTLKLKLSQDYIEQILNKNEVTIKDIRRWTGQAALTSRFQVAGGEIDLTIAQIMALYELNKRPQAKGHIYDRRGGIKAAPRMAETKLENGKVRYARIEKGAKPVKVTVADVEMIIATLTPEQKNIADAIQQFIGNEVASWGNEVTMELYGYEKFTAGQYFPIVTDKNNIPTKEGDAVNQISTIRNMGITKSTVQHANNPIIIEDIFEVYTRQVDQMSSYNAYVIPLSDLQKIYNYRDMRTEKGSIKQELERVFGKAGNNYIHNLMVDINGSVSADRGSVIEKMLSNMKAASVAGNLRVAIQQPTAYVRASMEIEAKYLVKGAATVTRKGQWELICKYAPIAQWKDWGFYRMDTSRQMKDVLLGTDNMKQRFVNKTMVLAEQGDKIAWNRLWRACEYECMEEHPELKQGTEEFYKYVGNRFSEIIDKTQVVDSVLHRTQIMRRQDTGIKIATSFMAEPLKTYDMLYRVAMDVKNGNAKAKSRALRAAAVFVATNVVTALAAAVIDAVRDDDRKKEYLEKYREAVWDNLKEGMNIINNIPYAKDIVSIASGYTPTRADTTAYQDIMYAYKKLRKLYDGDSSMTPQYVAVYSVEMTSKLLGLPIKSICRDAGAILDTAFNAAGGESDYKWIKQKYDIGHDDNRKLYAGMILDAQESGNRKLADTIRNDMIEAGVEPDKITDKIDVIIKKRYEEDERIMQAAQARVDGKPEEYKRIYNEILTDGEYPDQVSMLIQSAMNKIKAEKGDSEDMGKIISMENNEEIPKIESIYSNVDMLYALEADNMKGFSLVAEELYKTKRSDGKSKIEAISAIKSIITREYKKQWVESYKVGDKSTCEEIQIKLKQLKLDGVTLYDSKDWGNWIKEAKKKSD